MPDKRPAESMEDSEARLNAAQPVKKKTKSSTATAAPPSISQQAGSVKLSVHRQIKKQMKYQKTTSQRGTSRWSYTSGVANAAIFFSAFGFDPSAKKWKMKKMPIADFERRFGEIESSIRYGSLCILGEHVNVKWDEDMSTFTVSGRYGLSTLRQRE